MKTKTAIKAKVAKSVNDEEKVIIGNIQSLLQNLLSSEDAEDEQDNIVENADMETTDEQEESVEDEPEDKKTTKTKKAIEETPGDSNDANEDAEDKIDDVQSEDNEKNIAAVAKALMQILGKDAKPSPVQKSVGSSNTNKILSGIAKSLEMITDRLEATEEAVVGILEEKGVTKQLEIALKPKKVEKAKPIMNNEVAEFINVLKEGFGIAKAEKTDSYEGLDRSQVVQKHLGNRQVLKALVTGFDKKGE